MRLKKGIYIFTLLAVVMAAALFSYNGGTLTASTSVIGQPKIILDAGHGGLTNTID